MMPMAIMKFFLSALRSWADEMPLQQQTEKD